MKRLLFLTSLFAIMSVSLSAKAQEVTITLFPGWTWISYPNAVAMNIDDALVNLIPENGDVIKSQTTFSSYHNGHWTGGVTQFIPGLGYMYYSVRTTPVTFVFATPSEPMEALTVTTSEPIDITATTATCGGSVVSNDGTSILMRGVCWATHSHPTTNDAYSENGNDPGDFTVEITELSPNTVYYVRAYAVSVKGINYGEELSFTTDYDYVDLGLPSGLLWATFNVGANMIEGYGDYFAWGETQSKYAYNLDTYQYCLGSENTLTKYCNNPDYGNDGFTDNLTTLLPEDDAATANCGTDWRMPTKVEWEELLNSTTYTWTTQNEVYGLLFTAENGNSLFLPAAGYFFQSNLDYAGIEGYYWSSSNDFGHPENAWTINFNSDTCLMHSSNRYYGHSVRAVRCKNSVINVMTGPSDSGEVNGGGTYMDHTECTLTATANEGYIFIGWTENNEMVSTDSIYSFVVSGNRDLVAHFTINNAPTGAIHGKFTINANGNQIYFSQGNLQYIGSAAEPYWKFADNQWDYLGTTTGQNSTNQHVDRDLFGWGTSNWNCGNSCYHPWDTYNTSGSSYGPPNSYNLTGTYANADWGVYNSISNGGNQPNQWRTLAKAEWGYVFDSRTTATGIRYAKANVNDINGVILLPDDWSNSYYALNETNTKNASYSSNTISASEWYIMEIHGAVFLPAAGYRFGTSVKNVGSHGYYWSSTYVNSNYAYGLYQLDTNLISQDCSNRTYGRGVRLVCVAD